MRKFKFARCIAALTAFASLAWSTGSYAQPSQGILDAPPAVAASDSLAEYYNQGNAAYRDGDFSTAIRWYNRAVTGGGKSSALFYNLGNAHFRLGRVGRAILNYERAIRLDPRNEDARNNLEFASLLIADQVDDETSEAQLRSTLQDTLGQIPVNWLALGASFGLIGVCGIGAWWLLGGRRRALNIAALVFAAVLLTGSLGTFGIRSLVSDDGSAAIVLSREVEVRFEPASSAKVSFVVHEGTKLWIQRRENNWALVQIASGLRGWLPTGVIEVI